MSRDELRFLADKFEEIGRLGHALGYTLKHIKAVRAAARFIRDYLKNES